MTTIARRGLPLSRAAEAWPRLAAEIIALLEQHDLAKRDAIVLVPFVQLLAPARRAFAAPGGIMPRVETAQTLAASLGPPADAMPGAPTLDPALDRLLARRMLAGQRWGATWQRRDRRGFDLGARRVAEAAAQIAGASAQIAPAEREAWWEAAGATLTLGSGPGMRERALARIAFEWARQAASPRTDALFALAPSAWVAVQAGGLDALAAAVLQSSPSPAFVIDTNPDADAPFANVDVGGPSFELCDSFEREAQAAAAQVLAHLAARERPVALVAEDRVIVRRIRALLEPSNALLVDETGWKLSTTRAAAMLMTLLVAARREATSDHLFEWLKSGTRWQAEAAAGIAKLESVGRRKSAWRIDALRALDLDDRPAERVRTEALEVLASLQKPERRPLVAWLDAATRALAEAGALGELRRDAAGQQLLDSLGMGDAAATPPSRRFAQADEPLSLVEFSQWADELLEDVTFRPPRAASDGDAAPDVVVTPLSRAMLRPFAAAVFPGTDDKRLGAWAVSDSLLPAPARTALGLPDAQARRRADLLAFSHLLALPRVLLLRRRADGAEVLATSSFVTQLEASFAERGATLQQWRDPRGARPVVLAPIGRRSGEASAPARVPVRLSASAFEALRACPYRFFAKSMLRLGEDAELDGDLHKRDYGNWLHEVLHVFHERRPEAIAGIEADRAALHAAAEAVLAGHDLPEADFLPWATSFAAFVPRYVVWLQERERRGARWSEGESKRSVFPPALGGIELHGVIDRIDEIGTGDAAALELIDYKTGGSSTLADRVRAPFEDTQLAFYAVLVGAEQGAQPVKASYLALEAKPALKPFPHPRVEITAAALLEGVAHDMSRLRAGAVLVPLGEGDACRFCEVRGLCRRDHWSSVDADNDVAARASPQQPGR